MSDSATPWTAARQASLSVTNSRSLLKLMSIESVMPSNHLILCHAFLLLPSIFPSIRVFSNESAVGIRLPKYWSFSVSIFLMDIQGWFPCSPRDSQESYPIPQFQTISSSALSLLYGPTLTSLHDYWKNHSFDYMAFVGKVMSLLFNTLLRFVITFLPRSKHLSVSWLQSPLCSDFGAQENKACHCFPILS